MPNTVGSNSKSAVNERSQTLNDALQAIPNNELEKNKTKVPFVNPIWFEDVNRIQNDICLFLEQKSITEQDFREISAKAAQTTSELQKCQREQKKIEDDLSTVTAALDEQKAIIKSCKKSPTESIKYWLSLATGGFFKSARYTSEIKITQLSREVEQLNKSNLERNLLIKDLKNTIIQQEKKIQTELELIATADMVIKAAKQACVESESSGQEKINAIKTKCKKTLFLFSKPSIVSYIEDFIGSTGIPVVCSIVGPRPNLRPLRRLGLGPGSLQIPRQFR